MESRLKFHPEESETKEDNESLEAAHEAERAGKSVYHTVHGHSKKNKNFQKSRIRKEYQKAYRRQNAENATVGIVWNAKDSKVARKLQDVYTKNRNVLMVVFIIGMFLFLVLAGLASCAAMFPGVLANISYSTYASEPTEIDLVDLMFSEMEADLEAEIGRTESDYPNYDEYQYDVGPIGHDPFELTAYLHAKFESYTADSVRWEIRTIFDFMYELERQEVEEIRIEYVPKKDAIGNQQYDEDGYVILEEEEYQITVLETTLTPKPMSDLLSDLSTGQLERYNLLMESKGGMQQFASPVDLDWHSCISSYYGYRIHPLTEVKQLHRGIDIALSEGTPVYATHTGTVTEAAYDDGYGNYVVITDEEGFITKYAHMNRLTVSAGQAVEQGSQIGAAGNTGASTGSHLHLEVLHNGIYYNPLFYFDH